MYGKFKNQPMICCICGKKFESDFQYCGGYCDCPECKEEYEWRHTLYICGEEYYPKGSK
jgi:hypothetical protein